MNPSDSLLLCRGAGGVGCWSLNRNFVREFGTDATFVLSDMIRAYAYGDKIHTNMDEWFLWNANSMIAACKWSQNRLHEALDCLFNAGVFEFDRKKTPDEIWFKLNFSLLEKIGGSFTLKGFCDEQR